jgi:hypothetical protein
VVGVEQDKVQDGTERHSRFQRRVGPQRILDPFRPPAPVARPGDEPQEERGERRGRRLGRVPEEEPELLHPENLVDESGEARGEEQDRRRGGPGDGESVPALGGCAHEAGCLWLGSHETAGGQRRDARPLAGGCSGEAQGRRDDLCSVARPRSPALARVQGNPAVGPRPAQALHGG